MLHPTLFFYIGDWIWDFVGIVLLNYSHCSRRWIMNYVFLSQNETSHMCCASAMRLNSKWRPGGAGGGWNEMTKFKPPLWPHLSQLWKYRWAFSLKRFPRKQLKSACPPPLSLTRTCTHARTHRRAPSFLRRQELCYLWLRRITARTVRTDRPSVRPDRLTAPCAWRWSLRAKPPQKQQKKTSDGEWRDRSLVVTPEKSQRMLLLLLLRPQKGRRRRASPLLLSAALLCLFPVSAGVPGRATTHTAAGGSALGTTLFGRFLKGLYRVRFRRDVPSAQVTFRQVEPEGGRGKVCEEKQRDQWVIRIDLKVSFIPRNYLMFWYWGAVAETAFYII